MHQTFYLSFFLRMSTRGVADLKMAYEKPLLVVNVFFNFLTGITLWVLHGLEPFRKAN